MSSTATHADHALKYRAVAEAIRNDSTASSGEIMWLATVQAAQANGHRQDTAVHPQNRRGIRNVVGRLPVTNHERIRLLDVANVTVSNLHGIAYRPADIDDRKHQAEINLARGLVDTLLRYF